MLDENDPTSEVRFQQQHRFPLDGVGRHDSNLQDQGTPYLVVITHFEVRVGVEEPRCGSWTPRTTSTSVLELDLDIRFGTEYLVKFTLSRIAGMHISAFYLPALLRFT